MRSTFLLAVLAVGSAKADVVLATNPAVPTNLQITPFAKGLNFPYGMHQLPDGSLLVATSNPATTAMLPSTLQVKRIAVANGVANALTTVYDGGPGPVTGMAGVGNIVAVATGANTGSQILILQAGVEGVLTQLGSITFAYPIGTWQHDSHTVAMRAVPGQTGTYQLIFSVGSQYNDFVLPPAQVGTSGLISQTLAGASLYSVTFSIAGSNITAGPAVQLAKGLRNPFALRFATNGDVYLADNGQNVGVSDVATSADVFDVIPAGTSGVLDFGFPNTFADPLTGLEMGSTAGITLPVTPFIPYNGQLFQGAAGMALSPTGFPASLSNGLFVGFYGSSDGSGAPRRDSVVYLDVTTGKYFDFISGGQAGLGRPVSFFATDSTLYVSDLSTTGSTYQSGNGAIYKVSTATTPRSVYLGTDGITQGLWTGKYGADGYAIANGTTSLPAYASVGIGNAPAYASPATAATFAWSRLTSDVRALQSGSGSTNRVASTYIQAGYSNSFDVHINLSDGNVHKVALYLLDWDSTTRVETITISDFDTHQVLDTKTFFNFAGGEYVAWNLQGNININVSASVGSPVLSGIFFGPAGTTIVQPGFSLSATPATAVAGSSGASTLTVIPANGFNAEVTLGASAWPTGITGAFATNPATGASVVTISVGSGVVAGTYLLTVSGTSGGVSGSTTIGLTVSAAPGLTLSATATTIAAGAKGVSTVTESPSPLNGISDVTLSSSGWPYGITLDSIQNFAVTISVASFITPGPYTLTLVGTKGGQSAATTILLTVTALPAVVASASFTGIDTAALGIWSGTYGADGYLIAAVTPNLPVYANVNVTGASTFTWVQQTTDVRALQSSRGATTGIASTYYSPTSSNLKINVNLTDGNSHQVALYLLDWDATGLAETITITDAASNGVLDVQSFSGFRNGQYAVWTLKGNVVITAAGAGGRSAMVSALFLGPVVAQPGFTLSATAAAAVAGSTGTSTVTVTPVNGFSSGVTLAASGWPAGITGTFGTNPVTGSSTVTITVGSGVAAGPYSLTVNGTSGTLSASTTIALTVSAPAASFALGATAASVVAGSTGTSTVTVTPVNGFSSGVTLAASGWPAGITGTFGTNPATGSSVVTIAVATGVVVGPYSLTVNGTSGTLSASTTIALTVSAPAASFALGATAASVVAGSTGTSTVTVTPVNGFSSGVTLAASGWPAGITGTFGTNPATGSSVVTIAVGAGVAAGPYSLTVNGTSGTLSASTTIALAVSAPAASFALSATAASVVAGSTGTSTVTVTPANGFGAGVTLAASAWPAGITGTFGTNPATGSSVVTISVGAGVAAGPYSLTVNGTSGTLSASTTIALAVSAPAASFALSATAASVVAGSTGTSTVTVTPANGFGAGVTLAASAWPAGITGTFGTNPATGSSVVTIAVGAGVAAGPYSLTVNGTSGTLSASTTIALTVSAPAASFALGATAASVVAGSTGTSTVTVTPVNGFSSGVTLAASGWPAGITGTFGTNPATGSSVVTIAVAAGVAVGPYSLTVNGTSGTLSASTTIALTVSAPRAGPTLAINPAIPSNLQLSTFVSGISFPYGMHQLPDGSLLVATSISTSANLFSTTFRVVRITTTNGVADTPTVVFNGGAGPATGMAGVGNLVAVAAGTGTGSRIIILQAGTGGALTQLGNITFSFPSNDWRHNSHTVAMRAVPGQAGTYQLIFGSGSQADSVSTPSSLQVGTSGLISQFLYADSLYSVQFTVSGTTITATNPAVQLGNGLRNAFGLSFAANGDVYLADNGQDAPGSSDVFDVIPAGTPSVLNFGFANTYADPITGLEVGPTAGVTLPVAAFIPLNGQASRGVAGMAPSPTNFPASLSNGLFLGFFGDGYGTQSIANPVLFFNPTSGQYFDFIPGGQSGVGPLISMLPVDGALYIADLGSTGADGVIYKVSVAAGTGPSFTLGATTASAVAGASGTSTVTVTPANGFSSGVTLAASAWPAGITGTFGTNPASASSIVTITVGSGVAAGPYSLTLNGTSGTLSASTTIALTVSAPAPSFTLSATAASAVAGASGTSTVTVTALNGFSSGVTLVASAWPAGITGTFGTNPATGSSVVTIAVGAGVAAGPYSLTVNGTSGTLSASTTIALTVSAPAPSFTLSATAASAVAGASGTSTVTVTALNGFSSGVTLAASAWPAGITATFGTNPATGSSVVTIAVGAGVAAGPYSLTVNGTSGTLSASTTIALTVSAAPSFSLSATAATAVAGSTGTSTVTVTPVNGFSSGVTLAASGWPAGITATFGTNPATGSSVVTIAVGAGVAAGPYSLTLNGTSGTLSASTTIALTVSAPAPSFTLSATAASAVAGASGTSTVTVTALNGFGSGVTLVASAWPAGITGTFGTNPATGSSVVTIAVGAGVAAGPYSLTLNGTSGTLSASTTIALTVSAPAPSFTLSATVASAVAGASGTSTVTVTPVNGFSSGVTLAASAWPAGITGTFGTNPATGSSVVTIAVGSGVAAGPYSLTVNGTSGTSGTLSASTTIALTVSAPAPSFTLSATAASAVAGASGTSTVTVTPVNGFSSGVTLAASAWPAGITGAFGTNPATGSSVVTIAVGSGVAAGPYSLTVNGTSGTLSASTTIALTVSAPAPSFTLSATVASAVAGASGTSTVTVTPVNGFSSGVTLAASAWPAGITGTFGTNPTTGSSVVTISVGAGVAAGPYSLTLNGTSGTLSASTTIALTVSAPAPSFTLSATAASAVAGASGTSTVTVTALNGFSSGVTLAASAWPAGITGTFGTNPATGSSVVTIAVGSGVAAGPYSLTVNGTSGTLSASTTIALTVTSGTALGPYTGLDIATQGKWSGKYGADGYLIANNPASLPAYATVAVTGSATFTWAQQSTDVRALQSTRIATTGIAATYYSLYSNTLKFNVNLTDGATHQVALYLLDWDGTGLAQTITITDAVTNAVLDVESFSNFRNGQYAVWNLKGNVMITASGAGASSSMVSGLFFGPASGAAAQPSFTLGATAATATAGTGTGTSTVTVTPANGFNSGVTLAASGWPAGITGTFGTNPATVSSVVTISVASGVTAGLYSLTVNGTSGTLSANTIIALTVNAPAPSFTLSATAATATAGSGTGSSTVTVTPLNGFNSGVTLAASAWPAGITGTFGTNPATGSSVVTIGVGASVTPGLYSLTVNGTSGALTASTSIALTVSAGTQPTFTLSASTAAAVVGSTGTSTITVTPLNGFNAGVTLAASSWPAGITGTFGTNPATGSSVVTISVGSGVTPGLYSLSVNGTSGTLTANTTIALTVNAAPSFTLSATTATAIVGSTGTSTVTVSPLNGFNSGVTLATAAWPAGITGTFGTNPATASSVVTISAGASVVPGPYSLTVNGTSGTLTGSTTIALTVNAAPSFTLAATSATAIVGSTGTSTVTVTPANGFNSGVTLAASAWPTGITGTFGTNPATGSSVVTIAVGAGVAASPYVLTVNGTSGTLTGSTTIALTVSPVPTASSFAIFTGSDATTQGAWIGKYGSAGYLIPNGTTVAPTYAAASVAGALTFTWAGQTPDARALQLAAGSTLGIAAAYTQYANVSFSINVGVADSNTHRIALYLLDWDSTSRSQTITIFDAITNAVLDTQTFSGFHNGLYAVWNFKGSVKIKVTPTAGPGAVISGIFFN